MATNKEIENLPVNESVKRQLKTVQQCPVMFNLLNLIPTECTWVVPLRDMENYVLRTAEEFLGRGEVKLVTIEPPAKPTRSPYCYVWISRDSRHLVDRTVTDNDAVITPQVDRYSQELRDFCNQFAPTEREDGTPINKKKRIRLVGAEGGDRSIVAVVIDLPRVLNRLFDVENRGFQEAFGKDVPIRPCNIRGNIIYERRGDRSEISVLKITKFFEGSRSGHARPKASRAFRDSDRDRDYDRDRERRRDRDDDRRFDEKRRNFDEE